MPLTPPSIQSSSPASPATTLPPSRKSDEASSDSQPPSTSFETALMQAKDAAKPREAKPKAVHKPAAGKAAKARGEKEQAAVAQGTGDAEAQQPETGDSAQGAAIVVQDQGQQEADTVDEKSPHEASAPAKPASAAAAPVDPAQLAALAAAAPAPAANAVVTPGPPNGDVSPQTKGANETKPQIQAVGAQSKNGEIPASASADATGVPADASQNDAGVVEATTKSAGSAKDNQKSVGAAAPDQTAPAVEAVAVKPAKGSRGKTQASNTTNAGADDAAAVAAAASAFTADTPDASPVAHSDTHASADVTAAASVSSPSATPAPAQTAARPGPAAPAPPPPAPEARFSEDNHPRIIAGIHGQLLPNGGTMQIRLDPKDLGELHLRVEMRDGVMSATFQTSNDDATHLLSHSLGQLKSVLESQGVSVEKLQVQQAPRNTSANGEDGSGGQQKQGNESAQQEQQRRETLRRLWRRLSLGTDPLDLVA